MLPKQSAGPAPGVILDRQTGTAAYTGIMLSQRHRPLLLEAVALRLIWGLAFAGYRLAQDAKITPEKVYQTPIPRPQILQSELILLAITATTFVVGALVFHVRDIKT